MSYQDSHGIQREQLGQNGAAYVILVGPSGVPVTPPSVSTNAWQDASVNAPALDANLVASGNIGANGDLVVQNQSAEDIQVVLGAGAAQAIFIVAKASAAGAGDGGMFSLAAVAPGWAGAFSVHAPTATDQIAVLFR